MAAPKSHSEIGKMISIAIFFLSFSVSFIITYQLKGRVDFVGILTQLLISVMAAIFYNVAFWTQTTKKRPNVFDDNAFSAIINSGFGAGRTNLPKRRVKLLPL